MSTWFALIDLVRALVFAAAHVCGNSLGGGILAISVIVRVALLPLTLRTARRGLERQARIDELAPQLAALKKLHHHDRTRIAEATAALFQEHGIEMIPRGTFGAMLVQIPIGGAIYRALGSGLRARTPFLWIADLTRPDAIVAVIAAVLAGVAGMLAPTGSTTNRSAIAVSSLLTLFFAWRLTASLGLYWVASNAVGVVQSLILRRPASAANT